MNYLTEIPQDVLYEILSYLDLKNLNIFRDTKVLPLESFDSYNLWIPYFENHGVPLVSKKLIYFQWVLEYTLSRNVIKDIEDIFITFYLRESKSYEISLLSIKYRSRKLMILDNYLDDNIRSFLINFFEDSN